MEDPRLSRMYARYLAAEFKKRQRKAAKKLRERQRTISVVISLLLIAGFAAGYVAHLHGRFSRLKREIKEAHSPSTPAAPMPGGQEAIVLRRALLVGGSSPEFLSATMMPGRGMGILQITAFIPGQGEVPLLEAPTLEEAAKLIAAHDPRAREMGAPFELPWGGSLAGVRTAGGTHIATEWRGRTLAVPYTTTVGSADLSRGGLLQQVPSVSVSNNTMPDGGVVQGTYDAGSFNGAWPSKTNAQVEVLLSSRAIDLRVIVINAGTEPEPIGIGWNPHLRIPSGRREQARLKLPVGDVEEFRNGRATGRLVASDGPGGRTPADADSDTDRAALKMGRELRDKSLDTVLVHLRPGFLDSGPIVELRDAAAGVGLRLTAMTPLIRTMAIEAPAGRPAVTIRAQMNYDDPFSRVWPKDEDTGVVVLAPGQSVQWKARLEIVSLLRNELPL